MKHLSASVAFKPPLRENQPLHRIYGHWGRHSRIWSAVTGQRTAPVLMPLLCGGRDPHFVGEILQIGARFGTEGSEVQILSPRPISSKILRKSAEFSLAVHSG